MVVVVSPTSQHLPGMRETVEHFVQTFVAELSVEAFDEAILLRLSRRDIVPGDASFVRPFRDGARSQLSAVVRDDGFRPAIETDTAIELSRHTRT